MPHGWALRADFVEYGETLEAAALREGTDEASLEIQLVREFHAHSDHAADPRRLLREPLLTPIGE